MVSSQEGNPCLHISCIAGRFFTIEPPGKPIILSKNLQMPLVQGTFGSERIHLVYSWGIAWGSREWILDRQTPVQLELFF